MRTTQFQQRYTEYGNLHNKQKIPCKPFFVFNIVYDNSHCDQHQWRMYHVVSLISLGTVISSYVYARNHDATKELTLAAVLLVYSLHRNRVLALYWLLCVLVVYFWWWLWCLKSEHRFKFKIFALEWIKGQKDWIIRASDNSDYHGYYQSYSWKDAVFNPEHYQGKTKKVLHGPVEKTAGILDIYVLHHAGTL